jgi:hypothetical protein
MPIVQVSTSYDRKVACITQEHGVQRISSPVCQEVLRGRYEVVWVK